ncbi:MAG: Histidine kinase-, DNA gyrase B-, and HSP90-like ATPase [Phormidium sp. OSCR]|nr:MAG: Histidine kinase-, DNA gyrase B-, and HSP90-like ATPase [Phormidium sp. OSCR]
MSPEQTGRMNRAIDYRSDFYALGVTLYELLTGHLPFDLDDPMELIHCHIAKAPIPPHQRRADLPEAVSAIVLKLMAKTAEDRYQSSYGIQKDLETCLTHWTTTQSTLLELQRTQTQLIQTEKMSSLGQMVAGLAHEINNPISFIGGNIVYARDYFNDLQEVIELYQNEVGNLKPSLAKRLEEIDLDFLYQDIHDIFNSMQKGSDRIRRIILGLRNFSRLDESQSKMADIHEGLDSTLSLVQHRLNPPGQQPKVEIHKTYGELPRVNCYPSQLNQVFLNLLNNAIDALLSFNDQTHPTITIKTAVVDANHIQIQFSDNGPGMSEQVSQKIFDPFFTTKPVGQGTGLGLSISYQIITDQHQGQLSCDSQPGQGSQFTIEIPIKPI